MNEKIKEVVTNFIRSFLLLLLTGIVGILTLFGLFLKDFYTRIQSFGFLGIVISILVCIILSMVYSFVKFYIKNLDILKDDKNNRKKLFNALKEQLKELFAEKSYRDVIRLGDSISRALWVCGDYQNRVEIGEMVFEAANFEKDEQVKIKVLIDDIGWTYVPLNKYTEAKLNIIEGIKIAERLKDYYYLAKGNRHLANIVLFYENTKLCILEEVESFLHNAKSYSDKIQDSTKRYEMNMSILYVESDLHYFKQDYDTAIEICMKAREGYKLINDDDRLIKTFTQIGKIYLAKHDIYKARNEFLEGISLAQNRNRIDDLLKCYIGMAVLYYRKGDIKKFLEYSNKIRKNNINNIFYGWDIIVDEYNQIKKSIKNL